MKITVFITIVLLALYSIIGDVKIPPLNSPGLTQGESYIYFSGLTLQSIIEIADVAGVGKFMNRPSPSDTIVNVYIDDCWLGDFSQGETIQIGAETHYSDYNHPTNVPVVFFARHRISRKLEYFTDENTGIYTSWIETTTNLIPSFIDGDCSWFVKAHDNGLLYDFATNLWDCIRENPNPVNFTNVMIAANKFTINESRRLNIYVLRDTREMFKGTPSSYFFEKLEEPNLPQYEIDLYKEQLGLRGRFFKDGAWQPQPEWWTNTSNYFIYAN